VPRPVRFEMGHAHNYQWCLICSVFNSHEFLMHRGRKKPLHNDLVSAVGLTDPASAVQTKLHILQAKMR